MENVQRAACRHRVMDACGCMQEVAKQEEASRVAGGVVRASFREHSPMGK